MHAILVMINVGEEEEENSKHSCLFFIGLESCRNAQSFIDLELAREASSLPPNFQDTWPQPWGDPHGPDVGIGELQSDWV